MNFSYATFFSLDYFAKLERIAIVISSMFFSKLALNHRAYNDNNTNNNNNNNNSATLLPLEMLLLNVIWIESFASLIVILL